MRTTRRLPHVVAALALLPLFACAAAPQSAVSPSQAGEDALAATRSRVDAITAELDRDYVIGPTVAADLGMRIAWQSRLDDSGGPLKFIAVADDAILVLDSRNGIARLNTTNGSIVWREAVANEVDIFRGLHWAYLVDRGVRRPGDGPAGRFTLYLATDTTCHALDASTGTLVDHQRFTKLPATPPLGVGTNLVYVTIGGQLVWHEFIFGHELRANSLDSKSRARPLLVGNRVIAVSDRGMILCADASTARTIWTRRARGGIVARPAAGSGLVYVPSQDQYLWAFDAGNGELRWRYFTQSELTTSPYPIEGAVLQYVPTEGLVCLEADPQGNIDGKVRWRNAKAKGAPQGMVNGLLLLWDQEDRVATTIELGHGAIVGSYPLPQALMIDVVERGPLTGDLLAIATDGRVERLTPRVARSAARDEPAPDAR